MNHNDKKRLGGLVESIEESVLLYLEVVEDSINLDEADLIADHIRKVISGVIYQYEGKKKSAGELIDALGGFDD